MKHAGPTRVDTTTGRLVDVSVEVNGVARKVAVRPDQPAVSAIREELDLTGTKLVCGGGVCGACTATVDGVPVATCLLPATSLDGTRLTTIEGIGGNGSLHPVQRAFAAHDGLQCGYCTPGFVVDAAVFVDGWRAANGSEVPEREVIADALAGHLCRCGAYEGIFRAVAAACAGDHDDDGPAVGPRLEAQDKVTGAARYTADITLPGMLHGVIVRSDHAAGRESKLDLAPAVSAGAVATVDLRQEDSTIRFAGQPLAALAAADLTTALAARRSVTVGFTVQDPILTFDDALAPDARHVYADKAARKTAPSSAEGLLIPAAWKGNRRGPNMVPWFGMVAARRIRRAAAGGDSRLVVADVTTAVQAHTSFEPHGCVADWSDPDHLRLWVSTQAAGFVAAEAASRFGLRDDQVTLIAEHVGGGFGSKLGLTTETIAAVELSRQTRKPVKIVLDRREELTATGNRPGTKISVAMLADEQGELTALTVDSEGDGGVSVGSSVAALGALMYGRSPRRARDYDVVTNAAPGTPFRGPGGPPLAFALESAVDEMAERLDEDPIVLRQRWDGNARRQRLYDRAARLRLWLDRQPSGSATGRFRTGVGLAAANWFYFVDPDSEVEVSVRSGRLVVSTATQDMGTGSRSVLAAAVADVFEVDPHDVIVDIGVTGSAPHGPISGGSRTTTSLWSTTVEAATRLRTKLQGVEVAAADDCSASATRDGDSKIRPLPITFNEIQAGRQFSGAVHVAKVEVDTVLGKTRVVQVWGGINVGRIHTPVLARSQAEGSIIQGVGFALYEQRILDPHTGVNLTANLEDYRIPQLGDTPDIDIHFDEEGWEHVPGGGVGLGEVATLGTAGAVANAVHNATGWRPGHLPITPDRLVEALR